jgi:hypothetical protein
MTKVTVRAAHTANEFEHHNLVHLCGKLVSKKRIKRDTLLVVISCGSRRERKDKDGKIIRDIIRVTFYDDAAKAYDERFETGDFVTISGISQLVRDHYNGTSAVAIWGITMGPKYVNGHMIPDHNQVNILGKIESAAVISKNYILINVKTTVQKERKYLGESNEISSITQTYTSVTPIGVRCDGDAAQVVKQFTPGTYINSYGYVDTKKMDIDETHTHIVNRIISTRLEIVGDIQPVKQ